MRSACFLGICCLLGCSFLGCGTVVERMPFRPTGDLATTTPRSLVEAGHSEAVSPPAGVRFTLQLEVVRETPREAPPTQHFELTLKLTQLPGPDAGPWQADLHGAELVDDEGRTFKASEVLRQEPTGTTAQARLDHSYRVIFDLPLFYEPRRITRATVHWALVAPPRRIQISSRFRN